MTRKFIFRLMTRNVYEVGKILKKNTAVFVTQVSVKNAVLKTKVNDFAFLKVVPHSNSPEPEHFYRLRQKSPAPLRIGSGLDSGRLMGAAPDCEWCHFGKPWISALIKFEKI